MKMLENQLSAAHACATHRVTTARFCSVIALLLSLSLSFIPGYAAERILLIKSESSTLYNQVQESISATLESLCPEQNPCRSVESQSLEETEKSGYRMPGMGVSLVVTIGTKAAQAVVNTPPPVPVLFTLIPRATFDKIPRLDLSADNSAIYLDQPPERQLELTQQLSPAPKRVGILIGDANRSKMDDLLSSAERLDISLVTETVIHDKEIGQKLGHLLDRSDLLLALPDASIYNRRSIFNILLSSYHRRVPVIGFSAAYVEAGAILGVYASPADVGRHVAETIHAYLSDKQGGLPPPAYAHYFSIAVNSQVARSLDIDIPHALEIKDRLRKTLP